ncbi:MAG: LacI family DNA-binding transcriptional regulator [Firmicutes bacterium]|nr:LacI family DNA-binding transcriptional regulator [Bacillota bacterium]
MTIKDIAERCGVSVSTVSRVLNHHPDVSQAVRDRVLQVVEEVHYVPNNSARDLVKAQSDDIGIVVRGAGNPFFMEVIPVMEQAILQKGYTPWIHQINTEDDELRAGAELVRSNKLKGLILLGGRFDYDDTQIAVLDVPFVCCTYGNSFGKLKETQYSCVTIDDMKEAKKAVEVLIGKGHTKIAILLDSTCDSSISELRYRGYCEALKEAGIELDEGLVQETGNFSMEDAYAAMRKLLLRRNDFTAVFAIADSMALAAMRALHDGGKQVPMDVSMIAIDGIPMSGYVVPALTTLIQPRKEMGEEPVRILVDMIEGKANHCHVILPAAVREGESVRTLK